MTNLPRLTSSNAIPNGETLQNKEQNKRLRAHVPREFFSEHMHSAASRYLDCEVLEERKDYWPGVHRNVYVWWVLTNGKAVGWNENPARGWSFPVIAAPKT